MKRNLIIAVWLLAGSVLAGEHILIQYASTVYPTTAVSTVTYNIANKGMLRAISVQVDDGIAAVAPLVTGTVSAVRGGQSRFLTSFVVTAGTGHYVTLTNALFNETLSTAFTAGGTNAHANSYSVDTRILLEE